MPVHFSRRKQKSSMKTIHFEAAIPRRVPSEYVHMSLSGCMCKTNVVNVTKMIRLRLWSRLAFLRFQLRRSFPLCSSAVECSMLHSTNRRCVYFAFLLLLLLLLSSSFCCCCSLFNAWIRFNSHRQRQRISPTTPFFAIFFLFDLYFVA